MMEREEGTSMENVSIREESSGDEAGIARVLREAFPAELEANLVDRMRDSGQLVISLVALIGEQIVGHVAFSVVTVRNVPVGLGLAPASVAPARQNQGIGSELIRAGLEACRQSGASAVVVLGHPHFYARFGFMPASRWNLSDEYGGGEAFQAIELSPGAFPESGGVVRYEALVEK